MIKKIIALIKKNREFVLYALFGMVNVVISFSVFHICNLIFGERFYLVNNAVAWFITVTFSCITNKFIVFKSESVKPKVIIREFLMFYMSRIMTLSFEELGLWVLVDLLDFQRISFDILFITVTGHLIAKGMVGVVSITSNYLFSKFITFAKRDKTENNKKEEKINHIKED